MKSMRLMRGVPSSGKSYRAIQLQEELGGKIFSTDDYWYQINNPEKPDEYSFDVNFIKDAHKWNQIRVHQYMSDMEEEDDVNVIIDNTNITLWEMQPYLEYARMYNYSVTYYMPQNPLWEHVLEAIQAKHKENLQYYAMVYAQMSKQTHCVPEHVILSMFYKWEDH